MEKRCKRYDEDLKKMIVELYNTKSKPAGVIVREYGISNAILYRWVKEYSPIELGLIFKILASSISLSSFGVLSSFSYLAIFTLLLSPDNTNFSETSS